MNRFNSRWCKINLSYVKFGGLSIPEAFYIQIILDNEDVNGETLFSFSFLNELCGSTRRIQQRIIESLKKKNLIHTFLKGRPPCRYAKVNKKVALTYLKPKG